MTTQDEVTIATYPATRGARWLQEAFAMFSRARLQWLVLLVVYYATMLLVNTIPLIGQLAVPILKPVFAVGFLAAAWTQERGGKPQLGQLFRGFKSNLFALLPLGVVLLVGATIAVFATALVDGGKLLDVISGRAKLDEDAVSDGSMEAAMLFGALCALPVLLALWYAPALVVFHDCTATRAIKLSLRATMSNWRPLALYALLVGFYGVVVPGIVATLLALALPASIAPGLAVIVTMPYVLFLAATLHISDYVSYREIFHADETVGAK